MPHNGCITFGDLAGKLETLRLECRRCGRVGRYRVARLLAERGRNGTLPAFKDEIIADCPQRTAPIYERGRAEFPDLAGIV